MKLATSLYPNRLALAADRFRGEGVELGVAEGDCSEQILQNERCRRLWGIDRWSDHHGLAEYRAAAEKLAVAGKGRCVVLRMTFGEAMPFFGDESLDFAYVDGYAHTGQEAGRTIEQWWRKVKPGGVLAGHDYHPRWPRTHAEYSYAYGNPPDILPISHAAASSRVALNRFADAGRTLAKITPSPNLPLPLCESDLLPR